MTKSNLKKIGIISVVAIIVIVSVSFGVYKYIKVSQYNKLISSANKYMDELEYDKAIALFQQSLSEKDDANIKNNIKLAENLLEEKKTYDEGLKLMDDKKYLEAIELLKKISKESDTLYQNAQDKIAECNKKYVELNISLANDSLNASKYEEASKYITEALRVDSNNEEAKKIKDTIDSKIQEQLAAKKAKEEQEKDKSLSTKEAENLVRRLIPNGSNPNLLYQFDHEDNSTGTKYYVIHVYEIVIDHTATIGWYYVNPKNGKVFDGTFGNLTPIN